MDHLTLTDTAPTLMDMALDDPRLRIDVDVQQRVGLHLPTVEQYVDLFLSGVVMDAIELFYDEAEDCYWLASGFHRYDAATQAGLTTLPTKVFHGTKRDAILHAVASNRHGLQRSDADKRRAVTTLLEDHKWSLWSDREIASRCGVSPTFVGRVRKSLSTVDSENGDDETPQPTLRQYATKHGTVATMHVDGIGRNGVARCGDCGRPLSDPASISRGIGPVCACKDDGVTFPSSNAGTPAFTLTPAPDDTPAAAPDYLTAGMFSGEEEWFTPPVIVEKVRSVLGWIDLDPASCDAAQAIVQATTYFTKEHDGLSQPWFGRIFLNPPYSSKILSRFVGKLLYTMQGGYVEAAILLTNAATSPDWFQGAASRADAVCFTDGRLAFVSPDPTRATSTPPLGQAILYYGSDVAGFCAQFQEVGVILRPISAPEGEAALFPGPTPAAAAPDPVEVIAEQIESIVQESPRRRSENYGELPPRVLAALEAHGTHGATAATLAAAVDAPRKQVWASLERLVKQGTAAKQGTTYVVTKGAA